MSAGRPHLLKVFFSKRYTYAAITHKVSPSDSGHTIAAANTLQKEVQHMLKEKGSYCDVAASVLVGRLLAQKAKEAQVNAIAFENTKNLKYEGKVKALIDSIRSNGVKVL